MTELEHQQLLMKIGEKRLEFWQLQLLCPIFAKELEQQPRFLIPKPSLRKQLNDGRTKCTSLRH